MVTVTLLLGASGPAAAMEKIRFGLGWLPEAEHCGFFQAKATGLYEKAGLDVDLMAGGSGINTAMLVAGGEQDLGMGSSFTTLNMVKQGIPGVTVAAFFQKDPQTLVAHAGQGVSKLEDVKGRPVMVADFARGEFWQFLKSRFDFTDDQLRPYTYSSAVFVSDKTAIQQGYVTADVHYLGNQLDQPPVIMLLADHGYLNYATTVFGMSSYIEAHPDTVRAFLSATAEGWKSCMTGDYTPAMKLATSINTDPAYGEGLWKASITEMRTRHIVANEAGQDIGAMTDARWTDFFADMVKAGVYPADLDFRKAYTLSYLPGSK
ncbi:ABC transporter substrate-binding protein [Rhizobium laguerreae]|nr:ABC transporter substrate-binding protein [Rhizobium laguerreae]